MLKNKLSKLISSFILFLTALTCLTSCVEKKPPVEPETPVDPEPQVIEHVDSQLCPYCSKCMDTNCECEDKCNCDPLVVTKDSFVLYKDTIWETPGYLFKTNKQGPGIIIIGGTHGDETAGWTAAGELVSLIEEERKICGNILIVPKVNKLADDRQERFIGKVLGESNSIVKTVTIDGVTDSYTDLNRSFELGRASKASARTIWLSDQIVSMVNDFDQQFGADYIIDLHEAKSSWDQREPGEEGSLGDTLIFSNKPLVCRKILSNYNKNYRLEDEVNFGSDVATQSGSFSYNMSTKYPNSVVFTIETNRDFYYTSKSTGFDQIPLTKRVRQQLNMLRSMFDIAWGRI